MSKGFKLPLVIIFLIVFLSVPVFFYFYNAFKINSKEDVRGAQSQLPTKSGVTLRITSDGGAWDLHQFLCDEHDACLESLSIGKPWGVVSGGVTQDYEFNISPAQNWDEQFKYIKIFVRSSWGSMARSFIPEVTLGDNLVETAYIASDGVSYSVVLIPLENITSKTPILLSFKD